VQKIEQEALNIPILRKFEFYKNTRMKTVRNLLAIRRFSHGCYVLIQPHPRTVGKSGALFSPIHRSSMPCESIVQLAGKLIIYLIQGEGDFVIPQSLGCPQAFVPFGPGSH
jgi:hypothetical protein